MRLFRFLADLVISDYTDETTTIPTIISVRKNPHFINQFINLLLPNVGDSRSNEINWVDKIEF